MDKVEMNAQYRNGMFYHLCTRCGTYFRSRGGKVECPECEANGRI